MERFGSPACSLILTPRPTPVISDAAQELARRANTAPRKKNVKNLSPYYPAETLKSALSALGLSPDARPADLSLSDWQSLADNLHIKQ